MSSRGPVIRPASRRAYARQRAIRRRRIFLAVVLVMALLVVWLIHPWRSGGSAGGLNGQPSASTGSSSQPTRPSGQNPIKHIVFLVKENRTFDEYFGKYPGADGATTAKLLKGSSTQSMTLPSAPDVQPHDITHGFVSGILSIDGGKMDGYNTIQYGTDLSGYNVMDRNCSVSPAAGQGKAGSVSFGQDAAQVEER